jgi:hypothetical protein
MLAQLIPHMRLTEAALYSSPHWVVGIAAPVQQTDAGVDQGAYVALAHTLLQVRLDIFQLHQLPGSLMQLHGKAVIVCLGVVVCRSRVHGDPLLSCLSAWLSLLLWLLSPGTY